MTDRMHVSAFDVPPEKTQVLRFLSLQGGLSNETDQQSAEMSELLAGIPGPESRGHPPPTLRLVQDIERALPEEGGELTYQVQSGKSQQR